MPPVDWPMIQSMLLTLVLPCCLVSAGVLATMIWVTKNDLVRDVSGPVALVAGMAAGLFLQNGKGELIPFVSIEFVAPATSEGDEFVSRSDPPARRNWSWETGWRSLFSVTVVAALAEIALAIFPTKSNGVTVALRGMAAVACAAWLLPAGEFTERRWVYLLLAFLIMLNSFALRFAATLRSGEMVPLLLSCIWGGSCTLIMVLAHSARFADIALLFACSLAGVGLVLLVPKVKSFSLCGVPAVFVPGLMLAAALNTYSEIPSFSFWLVASAPLAILPCLWGRVGSWFESRPLILLFAFALPCGWAIAWAIQAEL